MSTTLVLGGARSGKSKFAEALAHGERHYIATAQALDDEMKARIAAHREQRGNGWQTHEDHFAVPMRLAALNRAGVFVLVDCLTLWLSNLMLAERDWEKPVHALKTVLRNHQGDVVLVSNEVGMGVVPDTQLGRQFRDAQGRLNQEIASVVDTVVFVAAGLPLVLKGQMPRVPEPPS